MKALVAVLPFAVLSALTFACSSGEGSDGDGESATGALSPSETKESTPEKSADKTVGVDAKCGRADDDDPNYIACTKGLRCDKKSLIGFGTCVKAKAGEEGAECKASTDCTAGHLKCGTSGVCEIPDFGELDGACDGRTETKCTDGLTCVHEKSSDLEGYCEPKR